MTPKAIYSKPTWELVQDFANLHADKPFSKEEIKVWFAKNYPEIENTTVCQSSISRI
ncbi:MAG: DUF7669 domain-containing protein [Promethearchaeota archaeon]